uniref:Uncharacterized protein n=1 Tax=Panagrolaimus superbus TaxID=310955 RepID=A0A914YNZ0_9BILA
MIVDNFASIFITSFSILQIFLSLASILLFCGNKKKKANKIKAPEDKETLAGTYDPNYQTLAGMGQDCFGADKAGNAGGGGGGAAPGGAPKAPAAGGVAGTHDPNYQTLAGMGNDVFAAK